MLFVEHANRQAVAGLQGRGIVVQCSRMFIHHLTRTHDLIAAPAPHKQLTPAACLVLVDGQLADVERACAWRVCYQVQGPTTLTW